MANPQISVFLLLIGCITALFAIVIYLSLRVRERNQRQTQKIKAMDLWKDSFGPVSKPSHLLVGLLADEGWTAMSLLIKNHRDELQAKASYRFPDRIFIEIGEERYEARITPETALYKSGGAEAPEPLCSYAGARFRTAASRYEVPRTRTIDIHGNFLSMVKGVFEIKINGQPAGKIFALSRIFQKGAGLLLPEDLPIHIRAFILAMEYRRLT